MFNKWSFLIIILVLLGLFRFINIRLIPPFLDETIYLSMADLVRGDIHTLFKPFQIYITPMGIWLLALIDSINNNYLNPLTLGRIFMVSVDLFSAYLLFLIGKAIIDTKYGVLAALIYISLPLTFFHSRFVLMEPLTNTFILLSLLFTLKVYSTGNLRKKYLLISLLCFFLASLTKPIALVSFFPILIAPFAIYAKDSKILKTHLFIILLLMLIILPPALFYLANFPLYFTDFKRPIYVLALQFKTNLFKSSLWLQNYLTWSLLLPIATASLVAFFRQERRVIWIAFWFAAVIFIESLMSKAFYPRHLYLIAAPSVLLSAYFLHKFLRLHPILFTLITILVLSILWKFNLIVTFNPKNAPIALEDKLQFFEDWTAGVGLEEVAAKLKELSSNQPAIAIVEDSELLTWGLHNIYDTGNTKIVPFNQLLVNKPSFRLETIPETHGKDVYFVVNKDISPPPNVSVKLIYTHPKGSNRSIDIYQLLSDSF